MNQASAAAVEGRVDATISTPGGVDLLPQWRAQLVLYLHQSFASLKNFVCILHIAQVWNQIFYPLSPAYTD